MGLGFCIFNRWLEVPHWGKPHQNTWVPLSRALSDCVSLAIRHHIHYLILLHHYFILFHPISPRIPNFELPHPIFAWCVHNSNCCPAILHTRLCSLPTLRLLLLHLYLQCFWYTPTAAPFVGCVSYVYIFPYIVVLLSFTL